MKTQALHLNIHESGLMSNLLWAAMTATGKPFEEHTQEVKMLSNKIARVHQKLEEVAAKGARPHVFGEVGK